MTIPKILQHTVNDIMQTEVVSISRSSTLRDALALMTEYHVGGLPVLDVRGRCIGLVSATDILNYEQEHTDEVEEGNAEEARYFDRETERWETIRLTDFALEKFGDITVSEVMAYDLISVKKDTSITEVARLMYEADIHRVVVLDDDQRLLGIVSAVDFVQLIAES